MVVDNNMKAALAECVAYADRGQQYWWRVASCKKLMALGFVSEGYRGASATRRYQPTPEGRAYLAGLSAVHLTK